MQIMNNKSINLHFLKWWNTNGNKELTLQTATTKQLLGVEVSHNLQKDFAIRQLSDAPHGLWHHLRFQLTWKAWCCNLKGVHLVLEECQACHLSAKFDEESIVYSLIITVFLNACDCNLSHIVLVHFLGRNLHHTKPSQDRSLKQGTPKALTHSNNAASMARPWGHWKSRMIQILIQMAQIWATTTWGIARAWCDFAMLWVACIGGWGDQVVGVAVTFCAQRHSRWLEIGYIENKKQTSWPGRKPFDSESGGA